MKKYYFLNKVFWITFGIVMSMCLVACVNSSDGENVEQNVLGTERIAKKTITSYQDGIVSIVANSIEYTSSPMIDSLVIKYGQDVVLPEQEAAKLYSFSDGNEKRAVTAVYTNDEPDIREEATSVEGRYVIVHLAPVENPYQDSGKAWSKETTAGRTTVFTGSHSALRTDFSEIEITQNFDMNAFDGTLIQEKGILPELSQSDIVWPEFKNFTVDEVLESTTGDIHYSYYVPEDYDESKDYPMIIVLPGYGGMLLSMDENSRAINIYEDRFVVFWTQLDKDMIVVSPQLTDWGTNSANQTIELTEYFIENFGVDTNRVYAAGYSAGGETLSRVIGSRADLFAGYLHCSSQWNGGYEVVAENRTAVYVYMAQSDEYYGPELATSAYEGIRKAYEDAGISEKEIEQLLVLELPDDAYFNRQGIKYYHGGGPRIINDETIVVWLLSQHK